jgi:hypothetical protein
MIITAIDIETMIGIDATGDITTTGSTLAATNGTGAASIITIETIHTS